MSEHTSSAPSASESNLAAVLAAITLIPAIYIAFWVIDWTSPTMFSDGSAWRFIAPVIFCIAVPSIVGSVVAVVVNAARD